MVLFVKRYCKSNINTVNLIKLIVITGKFLSGCMITRLISGLACGHTWSLQSYKYSLQKKILATASENQVAFVLADKKSPTNFTIKMHPLQGGFNTFSRLRKNASFQEYLLEVTRTK